MKKTNSQKFLQFILFAILLNYTLSKIYHVGEKCTKLNERSVCGEALFCNTTSSASSATGVCIGCNSTLQCQTKHSSFQCKIILDGDKNKLGVCQHKDLFPSFSPFDILATVLSFIGGLFASAGGIGGGGIFVPLFHTVGQFPTSLAIPLSKAMIFGVSICNFIILSQKRHPKSNRPLIEYSIALLFEPVTLLGTIIGVFCNVMFPNWLVVTLLLILLSATTVRTFYKGIKKFIEETKQRKGEPLSNTGNKDESDYKKLSTTENENEKEGTDKASDELEKILAKESSTPWEKFLVIGVCWIVIFTISLLKGGHGAPSVVGVKPCSWLYWLLVSLSFPIVLTIVVLSAIWVLYSYKKKIKAGWKPIKGDIEWNIYKAFFLPLICGMAGVFAGLLGIGGGMIKGPLLLEIGILPEVASATSSFMILFTSSITTAQFTILGRLPYDYGIWFAFNGFLSALVGQLLIGYIVKKYKKTSIIILIIAGVIGVSTILMVGIGISGIINDVREGASFGFSPPC